MNKVSQKRILIIGASSGIGEATASLCSRLGAKLALFLIFPKIC
jgi:NADP-dependent 3-hydroxy acid dehydrogenase YdfG